jgi:hypothetical protein
MSKIVSKIVGLFVPSVTAGACLTATGCCCGKNRVISCFGACVAGSCRTC